MWILPAQLHTSASAPATMGLDSDSEEFSQMCEKSLMWRSKPAASRTWLTRWKRENSIRVLSSRTLKPSHTEDFVDWWTSSLEDSRANPSHSPDFNRESKTQGTSSLTSCKESSSVSQQSCSSKTLKESSQLRQQMGNQFSNMSSEAWKKWVTEQRQEYSARKKSAHHTRESESLSWPTASTRDWKGGYTGGRIRNGKISMDTLDVAVQAYTTGGLADPVKINTSGKPQEPRQWGTPTARDHKSGQGKKARTYKELTAMVERPSGGQLNPDWVEHLMGLPAGWTDFGCLGTELSLR